MIEDFKKDVEVGLSSPSKFLLSKYFYDKKGGALFLKIMHSHEYYLTRAELEIFKNQNQQLINCLEINPSTIFELIELGAGDGLKTKELLKVLKQQNFQFTYIPIDISENALEQLEKNINASIPNISLKKIQGDYFKILGSLKSNKTPKVILFLGSNLGNMSDDLASTFITKLGDNLNPNDKLVLGLDLIKSTEIILPAYNDSKGYTRDFNLNLLRRINKELGANFELDLFDHLPEYCEKEGVAKSFLVSLKDQKVSIKAINKTFHFAEGEKIMTEISRKYDDTILSNLLTNSGFQIIGKLKDHNDYFCDYILNKIPNDKNLL